MAVAEIERAVQAIDRGDEQEMLRALAVTLAHPQQSIPLLKARYARSARGDEQLRYAQVLGILGDPTGAPALIAAVDAHDRWDQGESLTSQRKTGNTFSDLDRLVIALGFSRAPEAVAPLVRKLGQLEPESPLSHYKAISLALWDHAGPAAVGPLVSLLERPGVVGHATLDAVVRRQDAGGQPCTAPADRLITTLDEQGASVSNLNAVFKELIIASMLYRCGDRDRKAETILRRYTGDIHGHFARYARQMLEK